MSDYFSMSSKDIVNYWIVIFASDSFVSISFLH